MSWTYHWAVMMPRINTRGDHVLKVMAPHTIIPAVRLVCRCKAKAGLRRSPRGLPIRNTIVISAEIESGFVTKDELVPFHFSPVSSCAVPLQTEASMGGRLGEDT
ncbi:uncharacterized protein TNCV_4639001 [Trichonephila clavipes]|uniref:Uncharacterized protein n=1 Tax=Trichonephila clavipes TaxID=2585209 RepID=A0A8X7BJL7_TRICX|nr:uncharacterized protein TNCV_4639001 [Trichonephila clavipes]